MKFALTLPAFVLIAFLFHSCKPMPNDGIPFYMKIDSVTVTTDPPQHGLNTHKISDVWVEINESNLGAYELPCNFPVLKENDVRFIVSAGIMENGQSGVRVIYPFYTPDTFSFTALRGEKYTHTSNYTYKTASIFKVIDNFDNGNGFPEMTLCTDTNVRYGTRCGMLTVTTSDSVDEATLFNKYDLPEGQEIWLEFDYKCDVPFYAGYKAYFSTGSNVRVPVVFVTAQPTWNKMYVNLKNYIVQTQADTYAIYFEALRPYGTGGGKVYIDNVKLLHF